MHCLNLSLCLITDLKQQQSYNQSSGNNVHNHMQQGPSAQHFTQGPPPNMSSMQHMQQHQQLPNAHESAAVPYNVNQPPPGHQMWASSANSSSSNSSANGNSLAISLTAEIEALNMQQKGLRDQIHQSEANLTAQHTVIETKIFFIFKLL